MNYQTISVLAFPSFIWPHFLKVDSAGSANRPAATKSAGVIGKWGITSFTSLRSSCISSDAAMNGSKFFLLNYFKKLELRYFIGMVNYIFSCIEHNNFGISKDFVFSEIYFTCHLTY